MKRGNEFTAITWKTGSIKTMGSSRFLHRPCWTIWLLSNGSSIHKHVHVLSRNVPTSPPPNPETFGNMLSSLQPFSPPSDGQAMGCLHFIYLLMFSFFYTTCFSYLHPFSTLGNWERQQASKTDRGGESERKSARETERGRGREGWEEGRKENRARGTEREWERERDILGGRKTERRRERERRGTEWERERRLGETEDSERGREREREKERGERQRETGTSGTEWAGSLIHQGNMCVATPTQQLLLWRWRTTLQHWRLAVNETIGRNLHYKYHCCCCCCCCCCLHFADLW